MGLIYESGRTGRSQGALKPWAAQTRDWRSKVPEVQEKGEGWMDGTNTKCSRDLRIKDKRLMFEP